MSVSNVAYASYAPNEPLRPWTYEIREPLEHEILLEVHFCGICHSDIHFARDEWVKFPGRPVVPGHEFIGVVSKIGSGVSKWKVGDRVGVGCFVDMCRECDRCKAEMTNYCDKAVLTYGSVGPDGKYTYGGYGRFVVLHETCGVAIPDSLPMDRAAPLLCAGITVYSPIVHFGMNKGGMKIGVIGLGGLGHCAVMFAKAYGNEVYVFSRTPAKKDLAMELGAKDIIVTTQEGEFDKHKSSFDFIIDTVSANKDLTPYLNTIKLDGTLVLVGAPPTDDPLRIPLFPMLMGRREIRGSTIGSIKEAQEMVNFCAQKNILPYTELISCDKVNEAYERVLKSDVQFRFVLDVKNTHA